MIDEIKVTLRIKMKTEFLSRIIFKNTNLLEVMKRMRFRRPELGYVFEVL